MPEPGGYSQVHPKTYEYLEEVAYCSEGVIEAVYSYMYKRIGQLKHAMVSQPEPRQQKTSDYASIQRVRSDGIFSWNMAFLFP